MLYLFLLSTVLLLNSYMVYASLSSQYHPLKIYKAACFCNCLGNVSCQPVRPLWQLGCLVNGGGRSGGRRAELESSVLVGREWRVWSHFLVCLLSGGGEGDCSVVSLNKMAARPLSTRAHWTPTMTVRSAVWIHTECILPESFLTLHSR